MKILVTGGAGFIGSHVAELLLAEGHDISIIDDLSTGFERNLPSGAKFYQYDIRDRSFENIWQREKFEVMCHLAAQMNVRRSVEDPLFDADVNIRGTLNLLEIGRLHNLKKVIFASSGGAGYDDEVPFPTPETEPARPVSPYGIAKITTELHLRYYARDFGLSYVALRLGNVYGPRQNPHGEAGVVAIFSKLLLEGKSPVINGDGLQTRDYLYVDDVAQAFLRALKYSENDVFNIGTGEELNVNDIHSILSKVLNIESEAVHGPAKLGEVRRSCLAIKRARAELGWEPQMSVEEGFKKTLEYFRTE
ncbi:NAD-dependent epimerase/dehydratase family protein [bacterium]|nr:NAD-dependent epimerase/dehydratase family protein [bacterium]